MNTLETAINEHQKWDAIRQRVTTLLANKIDVPKNMHTEHSYRSLAFGVVSMDFRIAAMAGIKATDAGDYQKAIDAICLCEKLEEVRKWLVALPVELCPDVPLEDYECEEATNDQ